MNDHRVGTSLRAIRHRKKLRQVDVAARAGTSATMVARVERGSLANIPVGSVRRVAEALDARLDLVVRWHGGDFDRLINARHAGMHEAMAREFRAFPGWMAEPEVSFSVYGERGVIDILAWHPATRQLLVIELKTELVDINELLATLDRKRRLARGVAFDRGWDPLAISSWVVIAEGRTNRRAVANHAAALRAKLPADGRSMRAWLRKPAGRVDALSFLPSHHGVTLRRDLAPVKRVTRPSRTSRLAARCSATHASLPPGAVSRH
jgi:transcriptional regulator with XRE-family HTH domain